ncbi:hypothetical protein AAVH_16915 [Aphelenchoides avenae]|nr:hypothetical protein AAVH_16915 [Aphelenchus avenae]
MQSSPLTRLHNELMNNPPEINGIDAQTRKAGERIREMESENDGLRTYNNELEQKQEGLTVVQREVREEENDANAENNAELVLEVTQAQPQVEQAMQKETHSARNENHENVLLLKRIASLEQELSQLKHVRDQFETLKTLHQNTQRQMEALKEKLEAAETEVMSLKYKTNQLDDLFLTGRVVKSSLPKCCYYYTNHSSKGLMKVFAPPQGGAELDAFVADLFKGGTELNFPYASAPAKLFPTIIQAFKMHSARVNFRPLRLSSAVWPDAAQRSVRPCPFCVAVLEQSTYSIPVPHVTDRYHFHNAQTGQQMTVEFSYRCHHPKNVYGEPEEYWVRKKIASVRILVDDETRCRPALPEPPPWQLALPFQGDLLLAVLGFASRDDLDAAQLTCQFWRNIVNNAAGTLALRPLEHVIIRSDAMSIRRAPLSEEIPADSFDTSWELWVSNYNRRAFRPEDFTTIMSLLRHGCATRLESAIGPRFCAIAQHLAGTFRAESVILQCVDMLKTINTSLQLSSDMGVKDFELKIVDGGAVSVILANELLHGAERFHLQIGPNYDDDDIPTTEREFSNIQELCHELLRKAVACHVSFLLPVPYAVFSCDDIIEASGYSRKPTKCTHPTHREVEISRKVLPRGYSGDTFKYDVYHFQNQRTSEWLTVCLGKYRQWDDGGRIDCVRMQKGRITASVADIDKMEPFP